MYFEIKKTVIHNKSIVQLPESVSLALPSRGMVMAEITINENRYILPLEPDGYQGHWFYLPEELTEEALLKIDLTYTEMWLDPHLPSDLHDAFAMNHLLHEWSQLTPKAKWAWIRWIRFTNNPSTRKKRIETTCSMMKSGKKRPCCFDHSRCTDTEVSQGGFLSI